MQLRREWHCIGGDVDNVCNSAYLASPSAKSAQSLQAQELDQLLNYTGWKMSMP